MYLISKHLTFACNLQKKNFCLSIGRGSLSHFEYIFNEDVNHHNPIYTDLSCRVHG